MDERLRGLGIRGEAVAEKQPAEEKTRASVGSCSSSRLLSLGGSDKMMKKGKARWLERETDRKGLKIWAGGTVSWQKNRGRGQPASTLARPEPWNNQLRRVSGVAARISP